MVHHAPHTDPGDVLQIKTPGRSIKLNTHFSLSTPRRHRAPSITETVLGGPGMIKESAQKLSLRVRAPTFGEGEDVSRAPETTDVGMGMGPGNEEKKCGRGGKTVEDLPLEIQGLILDYIFGDLHSVKASSTDLQSGVHRLASAMRHPRRKALTDVALVSHRWRELVQERIYRHIKVKGNRAGLAESTDWFSEKFHLTKHVRHIEFWVPVWAEKRPEDQKTRFMDATAGGLPTPVLIPHHGNGHGHGHDVSDSTDLNMYDQNVFLARNVADHSEDRYPRFTYPFSTGSTSATLSEIFAHVACFFPQAQIFTLEGGHCKKSNMIRQFPATLFPTPDRRLDVLPNIRTFAMRGAWNIMREPGHWTVIARALPGVQDWHCGYAKPRPEAYVTINSILSQLPTKFRHVNICLDGFYSKDGVEGHGMLGFSPQTNPFTHHMCEKLGRIAPQLESLSFTGSICECFFRTATEVARARKEVSRLRTIDLVVKSCCRLLVNKSSDEDDEEGDMNVDDGTAGTAPANSSANNPPIINGSATGVTHALIPSPSMSATSGITNMTFIRSFERLILSAVKSLDTSSFPSLSHIRIRYIDLDSACPLLNPYFVFSGPDGGRCTGLWNEEIVRALWRVRPGSVGWEELGEGMEKEEGSEQRGVVRKKPKAIKGSVYRILADAR